MKNKQTAVVLMVLCMIGVSSATKILWCSSGTNDQGWVDLLLAEGYTVDRLETATDMNETKRNQANTYDLVIVGRDTNGGDYATNATEVGYWNSITAPMICQSAYIVHSGRWKWLNSSSVASYTETTFVVDPTPGNPLYEALFKGVTVDENGIVNYYDASSSSPIALVGTASAGNGTLIGRRDHTSAYVYAATWNQGVEFYGGSGYSPAGPRMALFAGGGTPRGGLNVTDEGELIFLNAVYYMSGATFNRKPNVDAGPDRIVNINEMVTLDATAVDLDSALTISWTQISGPGTATFEDNSVEDPSVTFDTKGVYTLEISADDTTTVVTDRVIVHVRDDADNALFAHWDFENLPDPNTLVDVSGNGFHGVFYSADGTEPNVIAGNMLGGSLAADLSRQQHYWQLDSAYRASEPNFYDLFTGMTVSAWVNAGTVTGGAPVIIGHGLAGWRLQVNVGQFNFACQPIGVDIIAGPSAYDNKWHHVVGVFDGVNSQARLYIDGLLVGTKDVASGAMLTMDTALQVGDRPGNTRPWRGFIDDIAIYNYPLTEAQIEALGAQGDRPLRITAGTNQTVFYKGEAVPMQAEMLVDDGVPAYATHQWDVVTVPFGADPANVIFSNANVLNPYVTFPPMAGNYVLRLTADDSVDSVESQVTITLVVPTCADVIADGKAIVGDLSGPQGTPDCRVDMYDLAALANSWLDCNDPDDVDCEWAYQQ
jgi:hypothetical protein